MNNSLPLQPVRFLDVGSPEANKLLGPLAGLQGTWVNAPKTVGWNVIAVPGFAQGVPPDGFVLEVIPYTEILTFQPAVVAANRGPADKQEQEVQQIGALIYEQKIISACNTDFCKARGFPNGSTIHMETGMFLNMTDFSSGMPIGRMSTIPHGNSLLALGTAETASGQAPVIPNNSISPSSVTGQMPFGYGEDQYLKNQFPNFEQGNPNSALQAALEGKSFQSVTTLSLSTEHATGGILNIPFIQSNVNTTSMVCVFWIEQLKGGAPMLQYSQTIDLVFPASGDPTKRLFIWPHVDVNTLALQK